MANAIQMHSYARQLQIDGKQSRGVRHLSQTTPRRIRTSGSCTSACRACTPHRATSPNAAKEMNTAVAGAPDGQKQPLQAFAKRLEAKEDINK